MEINTKDSMYFPYSISNKNGTNKNERYLGAKIKAQTLSANWYQNSLNQVEKVVVDTLAKLKTEAVW